MTLTVRLKPDLEKRFNAAVRRERRSKSEVVTQLLAQYVEARAPKSAYDIAVEVGAFDKPWEKTPPDLAANRIPLLIAAPLPPTLTLSYEHPRPAQFH